MTRAKTEHFGFYLNQTEAVLLPQCKQLLTYGTNKQEQGKSKAVLFKARWSEKKRSKQKTSHCVWICSCMFSITSGIIKENVGATGSVTFLQGRLASAIRWLDLQQEALPDLHHFLPGPISLIGRKMLWFDLWAEIQTNPSHQNRFLQELRVGCKQFNTFTL